MLGENVKSSLSSRTFRCFWPTYVVVDRNRTIVIFVSEWAVGYILHTHISYRRVSATHFVLMPGTTTYHILISSTVPGIIY